MSTPVFSRLGLIAWLETQDPETEYDYTDPADCLLCRYFRAVGVPLKDGKAVDSLDWTDKNGNDHLLSRELNQISLEGPDNYGGALARAKETI